MVFHLHVMTSPDWAVVVKKNLYCFSNRTMIQKSAQESKVCRRLDAIPGTGRIFSYADIRGELMRTTHGSGNVVLSSDSLDAYADKLESVRKSIKGNIIGDPDGRPVVHHWLDARDTNDMSQENN